MRIVSLVPSITAALHQLGLDDEIEGITDYCIHPQELVKTKARVGGTKNPDLQKILDLQPDLVIANTDEQRAATLQELEDGPWDLLVTETDSLDDVADTWTALGQATDRQKKAERKRQELQEALAEARATASNRDPVHVLIPVWRAPWMAAGGGTYLGDLLQACGMQNILAQQEEKWVLFALTLDPEDAQEQQPTTGPMKDRRVVALPRVPDAVLLPTEPYAFAEEHRSLFEPIGVPVHQVQVVDGELLTWWLSHTQAALHEFTRLAQTLANDPHRDSPSGQSSG